MEITLLIMEKSWNFVFEFLWEPCRKFSQGGPDTISFFLLFVYYRPPKGGGGLIASRRESIHTSISKETLIATCNFPGGRGGGPPAPLPSGSTLASE